MLRLLRDTFPGSVKGDDVIRWQYRENPFGETLAYAWEADGEIVCHSARLPVPATIDGRPVMCAYGVDAATATVYRRRGLYEQLRAALHDECCRRGIVATLLFLGEPSQAVPRVDVRRGVPLRIHVLALDAGWLGDLVRLPREIVRRLVRLPHEETAVRAAETKSVPHGIDELWSLVGHRQLISVVKDERWWRWRFAASPRYSYRYFEVRERDRLTGAAVTTSRPVAGRNVVHVLELLSRTDDDARTLVGTIARSAGDAGAVAFLATAGSHASRTARAAGLRLVPRRLERSPHWLGVWDTCANAPSSASRVWSATWADADYL